MACSIDLPQYWTSIEDEKYKIFYSKVYKQYLHFHPGIEYFRLILQKARELIKNLKTINLGSDDNDMDNEILAASFISKETKVMTFQDKIGRPYKVDIEDYFNLLSDQNKMSNSYYPYQNFPSQITTDSKQNQYWQQQQYYQWQQQQQQPTEFLIPTEQSIPSGSQRYISESVENQKLVYEEYKNGFPEISESVLKVSNNNNRKINEGIEVIKNQENNKQSDQSNSIEAVKEEKKETNQSNQKKGKTMFEAMMEVVWKSQEEEVKQTADLKESIFNSHYYYQPKEYDGDDEEYNQNKKNNKLSKHKRKNSNLRDEHILAICSQLHLKFPDKIHALSLIHEYITGRESQSTLTNPWRFRVNDKKEFFWINKVIKKTQTVYPYLSELKTLVDIFDRSVTHKLKYSKLKYTHSNIYSHFEDKFNKDSIVEAIKSYSMHFVQQYYHTSPEEQSKMQQPLKRLMEMLRSDEEITEEKIKNDIVFQWKYSLLYPFHPKQTYEGRLPQQHKHQLKGPNPLELVSNPQKFTRFNADGYYFSSSDYISSEMSSSANDSSDESSQVSSSSEVSEEQSKASSLSDTEEKKIATMQVQQQTQKKQILQSKASALSHHAPQLSTKVTDLSMTNFTDLESSSIQGLSKQIGGISSHYDDEEGKEEADDDEEELQELEESNASSESSQRNLKSDEQNNIKQDKLNLDGAEKSITKQGGGENEDEDHIEADNIISELGKSAIIQKNSNEEIIDARSSKFVQDKNQDIDDEEEVQKEKLDEVKELVKIHEDLNNTADGNLNKTDQSISFNNHLDDSTKISIHDQSVNDSVDAKYNLNADQIKEPNDKKLFETYNNKLQKMRSTLLEQKEVQNNQVDSHPKTGKSESKSHKTAGGAAKESTKGKKQEKESEKVQKQSEKEKDKVEKNSEKVEKSKVKGIPQATGKRPKSRELQKKIKNIVDRYKPDESILVNMKNALKPKQPQQQQQQQQQTSLQTQQQEHKQEISTKESSFHHDFFKKTHQRSETNTHQQVKKPMQSQHTNSHSVQFSEDFKQSLIFPNSKLQKKDNMPKIEIIKAPNVEFDSFEKQKERVKSRERDREKEKDKSKEKDIKQERDQEKDKSNSSLAWLQGQQEQKSTKSSKHRREGDQQQSSSKKQRTRKHEKYNETENPFSTPVVQVQNKVENNVKEKEPSVPSLHIEIIPESMDSSESLINTPKKKTESNIISPPKFFNGPHRSSIQTNLKMNSQESFTDNTLSQQVMSVADSEVSLAEGSDAKLKANSTLSEQEVQIDPNMINASNLKKRKKHDAKQAQTSFEFLMIGETSPKSNRTQRNSITQRNSFSQQSQQSDSERRRSSDLKHQIESLGSISDNLRDDNLSSKKNFFTFHKKSSGSNINIPSSDTLIGSANLIDQSQVLVKIKNNYCVEDTQVVKEEEREDYAEEENNETYKKDEQSRKERKRNNFNQRRITANSTAFIFASSQQLNSAQGMHSSTNLNGVVPDNSANSAAAKVSDPLLRKNLEQSYRHLSIFQSLGYTSRGSAQLKKKSMINWRDKIMQAIEAQKIKDEFSVHEQESKFDEKFPLSYQLWYSEHKSKQMSEKVYDMLETIDKQSKDNQKSVLLSDFMPQKSNLSTSFTKFDAVKINQAFIKDYNLIQEIKSLKNRLDSEYDFNDYEYESLAKQIYNINLPSIISRVAKVKDNYQHHSDESKENHHSYGRYSPPVQSNVEPNFYFPIIQPLKAHPIKHGLNFRSESASPPKNKLNKFRPEVSPMTDRNMQNIKLMLNNNNKGDTEGQQQIQTHWSELEESKLKKLKQEVTQKIDYNFEKNLRLHFLQKEVLEREDAKYQKSLKLVRNIRYGPSERSPVKFFKGYSAKNNNNSDQILKNGIDMLKNASLLNRSLSPKTLGALRQDTSKVMSDSLPKIILKRMPSGDLEINGSTKQIQDQNSSSIYKTFPNDQVSSLHTTQNSQFAKNRASIMMNSEGNNGYNSTFAKRESMLSRSLDRNNIKLSNNESSYQLMTSDPNLSIKKPMQLQNIKNQVQIQANNQKIRAIKSKRFQDEKESEPLIEKIHNLNKFEDNYTSYKLKAALENLINKSDRISHSGIVLAKQKNTQFSAEAQNELQKIQLKFFKQKLDLLIFDIIVCALNLTKEAKKLIIDSEILQARFYNKFRKYFSLIRDEILQIPTVKDNYMYLMADPSLDIFIIDEIYQQVQERCQKVFLEMKTINVLEATIIYQMKKQANQQVFNKFIHGETSGTEKILEKQTFLDESEDSGDEDDFDTNPYKVFSNFFILNSQLFTDYITSLEKLPASSKNISNPNKRDFIAKFESKQQVEDKIFKLKKKLSRPESIDLLQRFLTNQQHIEQQLRKNRMFVAQWNELGKIHQLTREKMAKFYVLIDSGLLPLHVFLMCQKIGIDVQRESDLIWVAMLYCYFVLRFTKYNTVEALNFMLEYDQIKHSAEKINQNYGFQQHNHSRNHNHFKTTVFTYNLLQEIEFVSFERNLYDTYFMLLLEFQRVKREILFIEFSQRQKQEYINNMSWYKFYDSHSDVLYYLQPQSNIKKTRLNRLTLNLQRKFETLEKAKFIELIDIVALIARQDQIVNVYSNDNDESNSQVPLKNNENNNQTQIDENSKNNSQSQYDQKYPKLALDNKSPSVKIIKFENRIPLTLIEQELKRDREIEVAQQRRQNLDKLKLVKKRSSSKKKVITEEVQKKKSPRKTNIPEMWSSQNSKNDGNDDDEDENSDEHFNNFRVSVAITEQNNN